MTGSTVAVRAELKQKPGTVRDLSRRTGFAPSTVRSALKRLKRQGYAVEGNDTEDGTMWHFDQPRVN